MRATTVRFLPLYIMVFLISIGGSLVIAIGGVRLIGGDQVGESRPPQSSAYDDGSQLSAVPETPNALLLPTVTSTPTPDPIPATLTPPTRSPTIPPTPTPIHRPAHSAVELTGFRHEWQTWNNCGPATLAMYLSYFGSPLSQADIGAVLRPYADDKNVSPLELVEFARDQGYLAQLRVDGSEDLTRTLLSNGIPVMIESWLSPEDQGGLGHYRLLVGFDDDAQHWIAYDSFISTGLVSASPATYQGIYLRYEDTKRLWSVFNNTFILIFSPAQETLVRSILGDTFEESAMWHAALQSAQRRVRNHTTDAYAWFNLGTTLVHLEEFAEASNAFDKAQQIGLPLRMLWYQFEPFPAYYAAGRYEDVVALADAVLATTQSVEEIYYWKGLGLAARGDSAAAQEAWRRAATLNPTHEPTRSTLHLSSE